MRLMALLAFAAVVAAAGTAAAALPFDPDEATRAWLATMGPEAIDRSNRYFTGNYLLDLADSALTLIVAGLLLVFGFARGVRGWLERMVKFYPLVVFGSALFYNVVATLATFPYVYYRGFVREHEFGLATQTPPQWLSEYLLSAAIGIVIGAIFFTIIYAIIAVAKKTWWIWGSGVALVFAAFLLMVQPVFIDPIFNTYTPMQDSALKTEILGMAQANGIPADNVYVYDQSRQNNRVTANVAGLFGTTRVALADNLLNRTSPEAVKAVMGHEMGHYVLGHIYSLMIMLTGLVVVTFAAAHYGFRALSKNERWGIRDIADPAGLPLLMALITAIGLFTAPLQRNIIRFHEQQADMFGLNAARAPDGFAEASVLLSEYRKMEPSTLEEWFFYDHPSGWNRIHNSMVWKAHEIELGRLPPSAGGPPPGWRPDFIVMRDRAPAPAQSPAAPSN